MAKLIYFDMEGTIFKRAAHPLETLVAPSAWYAIAEELGPQALEEELLTQKKWENGRYGGYLEWIFLLHHHLSDPFDHS